MSNFSQEKLFNINDLCDRKSYKKVVPNKTKKDEIIPKTNEFLQRNFLGIPSDHIQFTSDVVNGKVNCELFLVEGGIKLKYSTKSKQEGKKTLYLMLMSKIYEMPTHDNDSNNNNNTTHVFRENRFNKLTPEFDPENSFVYTKIHLYITNEKRIKKLKIKISKDSWYDVTTYSKKELEELIHLLIESEHYRDRDRETHIHVFSNCKTCKLFLEISNTINEYPSPGKKQSI